MNDRITTAEMLVCVPVGLFFTIGSKTLLVVIVVEMPLEVTLYEWFDMMYEEEMIEADFLQIELDYNK